MIIFGDNFTQEYQDKYRISKSIVEKVFVNPLKTQRIENEISLFLKEFSDNKLSHLLIGTAFVENNNLFSFAFWIPKEFITEDVSLLDILKIFANKFGLKIKISDTESYFIEKITKSINEPLVDPFQILEILGPESIPCQSFLFYKLRNEDNLNYVDCFYCFSINENKYFYWLYEIEEVNISIKRKWFDFLKSIKEVIDPKGSTSLQIIKPQAVEGNESDAETLVEISNDNLDFQIPKIYLNQFNRINELLNELGNKQKILVIPKYTKNKCLFCEVTRTSKEHIFPKWFKDFFEEKFFDYSINFQFVDESFIESLNSPLDLAKWSSYGLTSHNVCENCNNGWMSKLEEKAKNILLEDPKKLKSKIEEINLNTENKFILSLWVTIKAILLLVKANILTHETGNIFYELKENKIPNGFLVEMTEFNNYDLNFEAVKGIDVRRILSEKKLNQEIIEDLTKDFLTVCIQVGNFVFRVSYLEKSKGLKRMGYIKPTIIIHPCEFELPYKNIEGEEKKWDLIEEDLKLRFISLGLLLTD